MNVLENIQDPDIQGWPPALKRAARAARELAVRTRTPLHVWKGDRVVDALAARRGGRTASA